MAGVPFIDIFAGPGGLSEGFSRLATFTGGQTDFECRLAIEKDPVAARTLALRSFYRAFPEGEVPDDYYQVIRGKKAAASLALHPEWEKAEQHVWNIELGVESEGSLHRRIAAAIDGTRNWVLLGGPPCQAYSLMGRARMTGIGAEARESGKDLEKRREAKRTKFAADKRHVLYREYLRIVAVHQPAIFVMENVKGILSSRLAGEDGEDLGRVFEQIRSDLSDPTAALATDTETDLLTAVRPDRPHRYHLYSLVVGGDRSDDLVKDGEFLIRSEDFGVPQKRHRVILLGVRDDISVKPLSLLHSDAATVKDAIGDLPALRSGLSKGDSDWDEWIRAVRQATDRPLPGSRAVQEVICDFLYNQDTPMDRGAPYIRSALTLRNTDLGRWYRDARLSGVIQHEARSHMPADLPRYLYAAAVAQISGVSPKLEDWPPQLLPDHRNVQYDEDSGLTTATGFSDRFKVQVWNQAASTVTSHIAKDGHYFIHPDPMQCRSLTVREAARLQTFPDNYFFCGNRTQQYHQVGNAVPPYLACQIAGVVAKLMEDGGLTEAGRG